MQRLKTRPQFQAAMAGGTVYRTEHFALHRLLLQTPCAAGVSPLRPALEENVPRAAATAPAQPQDLFPVGGVWLGAMAPKRWARRAVTRNAIKRQVYTVGATFEDQLSQAAYVVRLRTAFDRKQFLSASSDVLKQTVRVELLQLFAGAARRSGSSTVSSPNIPVEVAS